MKVVGDALLIAKDSSIDVKSLIVIEAFKSLGWIASSERESIRAAALQEAADKCLTRSFLSDWPRDLSTLEDCHDVIKSLTAMPPEYVVVKMDSDPVQNELIERRIEAESKMIAEWLVAQSEVVPQSPHSLHIGLTLLGSSLIIERGKYRTKETDQ
jgi:hypothetical protein